MPSRQDALTLLQEYVQSESLRLHCLAVACAMESYAFFFNENTDLYWITGLLHDFDYERFPTLEQHPFQGSKILREKGYPAEIIDAILGHGDHTGVPRISNLAKALFAVDELSGLLVALAKVRADHFRTMSSDSVEKALKKKGFAAAVNRADIQKGIQELGVDRKEHFEQCIASLSGHAAELGFS